MHIDGLIFSKIYIFRCDLKRIEGNPYIRFYLIFPCVTRKNISRSRGVKMVEKPSLIYFLVFDSLSAYLCLSYLFRPPLHVSLPFLEIFYLYGLSFLTQLDRIEFFRSFFTISIITPSIKREGNVFEAGFCNFYNENNETQIFLYLLENIRIRSSFLRVREKSESKD